MKQGVINTPGDDTGSFSEHSVDYKGRKAAPVNIFTPYGLCSVAPKGSLVNMFSNEGQESNRMGLADYPQLRFDKLKAFEVQLGNYQTRGSIKFDNSKLITIDAPDGDVLIKAAKSVRVVCQGPISFESETSISFKAPNATADFGGGMLNVTSGDIQIGSDMPLGQHTHPGVTSGGSNTGAPN
jgi:hypothetical protein